MKLMSDKYYDNKGIEYFSESAAQGANERYVREEREAREKLLKMQEQQAKELRRQGRAAQRDRDYEKQILFLKESDEGTRLSTFFEMLLTQVELKDYTKGTPREDDDTFSERMAQHEKTVARFIETPSLPEECKEDGSLTVKIIALAGEANSTALANSVQEWISAFRNALITNFFGHGLWVGDGFSTRLRDVLNDFQSEYPPSCRANLDTLSQEQVQQFYSTLVHTLAKEWSFLLTREWSLHLPHAFASALIGCCESQSSSHRRIETRPKPTSDDYGLRLFDQFEQQIGDRQAKEDQRKKIAQHLVAKRVMLDRYDDERLVKEERRTQEVTIVKMLSAGPECLNDASYNPPASIDDGQFIKGIVVAVGGFQMFKGTDDKEEAHAEHVVAQKRPEKAEVSSAIEQRRSESVSRAIEQPRSKGISEKLIPSPLIRGIVRVTGWALGPLVIIGAVLGMIDLLRGKATEDFGWGPAFLMLAIGGVWTVFAYSPKSKK